jgi:hypothetical protein
MAENLTATRIAENQSRFREANEEIELAAEKLPGLVPVPFICECPRETCTTSVPMTLEDYEDVRSHPRRFVTAPGHQDIAVESGAGVVVEELADRVLVDKVGEAGSIAEERFDNLA